MLLSSCQSMFSKRAQELGTTLLNSAQSEPLSRLVTLIRQAWALQQQAAVSKTVELAATRARACCTTLQSSLSSITHSVNTVCDQTIAEGCSTISSLSCLAALHHSRFSNPQCSRQHPGAQSIGCVPLHNQAAASNASSQAACLCTICSSCHRISTAMLEAVGLCLGQLASRAAAAMHWGIFMSSLAAVTFKKVCTVPRDYYGWIDANHARGVSDAAMNSQQEDQGLASYQAQCTLQPTTRTADPAARCCSMRLMLGLHSFQEHQHESIANSALVGSHQVQPPFEVAIVHAEGVPDGALELSEALLQTILGMFSFALPCIPSHVLDHVTHICSS